MPELPEVETIRRQMKRELVGDSVREVEVRYAGRLNMSAAAFAETLRGARVVDVRRRAKLLLVDFSNERTIVAHLKMTGKFLLAPKGAPHAKHTHVRFGLASDRELFFDDARKFGYLKLLPTRDVERDIVEKLRLGPEPLERAFTAATFIALARRRARKRIKPLLTDQTFIAGVGNIYADEACWRAKVHPNAHAGSLDDAALRRLHRGVIESLKGSIGRRGTSADAYRDLYGRMGTNEAKLHVYGREGEPCDRCGAPIRKIRLAGRGTHFCPNCQKA